MLGLVSCQADVSNPVASTPSEQQVEQAEAATGPKLTAENYAAIQTGMTQAQVEELLGPGEELSTTELVELNGNTKEVKSYIWSEELNFVSIIFENNRVVSQDKSGF